MDCDATETNESHSEAMNGCCTAAVTLDHRMLEDWRYALAEWNRLQKRRLEMARELQECALPEDGPPHLELEQIDEQQAILELALGAYELLA